MEPFALLTNGEMCTLLKTAVKLVLLVMNVPITLWEVRVTKDGTVKMVILTALYVVLMKYVQLQPSLEIALMGHILSMADRPVLHALLATNAVAVVSRRARLEPILPWVNQVVKIAHLIQFAMEKLCHKNAHRVKGRMDKNVKLTQLLLPKLNVNWVGFAQMIMILTLVHLGHIQTMVTAVINVQPAVIVPSQN